jgi:hypothetical protein
MRAPDKLAELVVLASSIMPEIQERDPTLGTILAYLEGHLGGLDGAAELAAAIPAELVDSGLAGGMDVAARLMSDDAPAIVIVPGQGAYWAGLERADELELTATVVGSVSELAGEGIVGRLLAQVPRSNLHRGDHVLGEIDPGPGDRDGGSPAVADRGPAGFGDDESAGGRDILRPSPAA